MRATTDELIQDLFNRISKGYFHWRDFKTYFKEEKNAVYFSWYYAEDGIYLIRDDLTGQISFILASSPLKALHKLEDRLDEALHVVSLLREEQN